MGDFVRFFFLSFLLDLILGTFFRVFVQFTSFSVVATFLFLIECGFLSSFLDKIIFEGLFDTGWWRAYLLFLFPGSFFFLFLSPFFLLRRAHVGKRRNGDGDAALLYCNYTVM